MFDLVEHHSNIGRGSEECSVEVSVKAFASYNGLNHWPLRPKGCAGRRISKLGLGLGLSQSIVLKYRDMNSIAIFH